MSVMNKMIRLARLRTNWTLNDGELNRLSPHAQHDGQSDLAANVIQSGRVQTEDPGLLRPGVPWMDCGKSQIPFRVFKG